MGLGFYPTCKPTSKPATVSCMLPEDRRFLGQRQWTPLLSKQHDYQHVDISPLVPNSHGGGTNGLDRCLHRVDCGMGEDSKIKTQVFSNGCPFLWREILSPSSMAIHCTNILEKRVQDKGCQCLACKMCRTSRDPWRIVLQ